MLLCVPIIYFRVVSLLITNLAQSQLLLLVNAVLPSILSMVLIYNNDGFGFSLPHKKYNCFEHQQMEGQFQEKEGHTHFVLGIL